VIGTCPFSDENYFHVFRRLNLLPYCSEDVLKGALSKIIIKLKFIKIDLPPSAIKDSIDK